MPELHPERLALQSGPGPLLASLPAALDRPLVAHDLLLIGARAAHGERPARTILIALDPDIDYSGRINEAAEMLAESGATEAVLIEHSGRFFAEQGERPPSPLEYAAEGCSSFGISIIDVLTISDRPEGRRWRSLGCSSACCPPEGNPIPETGANPA